MNGMPPAESLTRIELVRADITTLAVDAIVNAANASLCGGGGVDGAIHRAAGPLLLAECRSLGRCATGHVKITKGYDLPARFVIHAVGPVWRGGQHGEDTLLVSCYEEALALVRTYGLVSIAFPSIATGAYRFPVERAAPLAISAARTWVKNNPSVLQKIVFVVFSENDHAVYRDALAKSFEDIDRRW